MTDEAPHPVSNVLVELEITGCLTAFNDAGQPVLLSMPDTDDMFVAVFSTKEKLDQLWRDYPHLEPIASVKVIMNGPDFIDSILEQKPHWRVIIDPYKHENGKLRFTELIPYEN